MMPRSCWLAIAALGVISWQAWADGLDSDARASCVAAPSGATAVTAVAPAPETEGGCELLLVEPRLARVRIDLRVNGQSATDLWAGALNALYAYCDANADGRIDESEGRLIPAATGIRQLLWRPLGAYVGRPPAWNQVDANGNQQVELSELAAYYRAAGVGSLVVGLAVPNASPALTAALLDQLDSDSNKELSQAEWNDAQRLIDQLDRNDDELLDAEELVPLIAYPGTTATTLLSASTPASASAPLVVLADDQDAARCADVLATRYDRNSDGLLDGSELAALSGIVPEVAAVMPKEALARALVKWRDEAPPSDWHIAIGSPGSCAPGDGNAPQATALIARGHALRVYLEPGAGERPLAEATARILAQFDRTDANADAMLDAAELGKGEGNWISPLRLTADRDGDGLLARTELQGWLDLQSRLARSQLLLTVLDHQQGLFELLDTDHSGALSRRELRGAWSRLVLTLAVVDGKFDAARLPRQWIAIASQAQPRQWLGHAALASPAPVWFQGMDRNRDGDISLREFLGTAARFHELDGDADGLLSLSEAAAAR